MGVETRIDWKNPDNITILKDGFNDDLSASQIASQIEGATRNAVIGKMRRMGLTKAREPRQAVKHVRSATRKCTKSKTTSKSRKPYITKAVQKKASRKNLNEPASLQLSILELERKHCKYPHGDVGSENFGFCGHPTFNDSSWCEYHHARCIAAPVIKVKK